jgi:acyl-CoA dehydrogenase
VAEREQFGRPLVRFQAVQQQLAALAAEVTAMQVAADAAVLATEDAEADPAARAAERVAVAAAKAVTSAGAQVVASIGHQLHGALGYTHEHRLGAFTTRLWSWREEFGSEGLWHDRLAAAVAERTAWWPLVAGGTVRAAEGVA